VNATRFFPIWLSLLLVLIFWQLAVYVLHLPHYLLPAPTEIARAMWETRAVWPRHLWVTLVEAVIGLSIAVAFAVGLAVVMHQFERFRMTVYPLIIVSQTIPIMAISPIFIVWFDYTIWSKVAVVVLWTFFPLVINLNDGFRSVKPEQRDMLRSLGANRRQLFFWLEWPHALNSFFSGLKMAAAFSVVGATVGEWLGAEEGLGFFTRRASNNMQIDVLFVGVILLSILGLLLFYAAHRCAQLFLKGRQSE
jgi:putative hydroxymethylpyrimidine transport system permease protein